MKTLIINIKVLLSIFLISAGFQVYSQDVENDFQSRAAFDLQLKPIKKLKINISPEIRFDESFSVAKYLLETEVSYKLIKHVYVGGNYRFIVNPREGKDTELSQRFGFNATYKNKINDFTPAFRLSYTNYSDDISDSQKDNFLRYKLSLKYDIPKNKITPSIGAELYHQMDDNQLYKIRYKAEIDYKLFKHNYISVYYKFDYYLQEYKNKNIIGFSYKLKL